MANYKNKGKQSSDTNPEKREAENIVKNYSRVPNMLCDGYPDLLPQEKWLYVCLIRLCGQDGTRFLSLRHIAKHTGFSIGALSASKKTGSPGMLRRLHDAGLIHAEIKKKLDLNGSESNNAQFHVTITDVWMVNYNFFYGDKCSEVEQVEGESESPVRKSNASVRNVNGLYETCSEDERTCSTFSTIVIQQSNTTDKSKITDKENTYMDVDAIAQHPTLSKQIIHPLYDFIALDDSIAPTQLIVFLTSEKYSSEYEDKQRAFKAEEVKVELERRGHTVSYCWMHEAEPTFAPTVVASTQQETSPSDTESHSHQETQALPHQGYVQSQDARPFMHAPLQGGANVHPSSDSMTPPTTSVANTPRRSGDLNRTGATNGQHNLLSDSHGDAYSDSGYRGSNDIDDPTHGVGFQQVHRVGTQDTSFLPAHPTENSPAMPSPSNEPPTPTTSPLASSQRENEASSSNGTSKQAMSYSLDGHTTKVTQAEQHPLTTELFSETPTGNTPSRQKPVTPEMPPAEMKWCAEKLVQITECKRIVRGKVGAYFDEGLPGMGAKSQRQRQLEAAKKIIARGITEGQYLLAYDDCNNEWWNTNKGSVTVETMAANTPRKIMRAVELIESLESKSQTIAGARMAVRVISQQIPPASSSEIAQMTEEEANQLAYVAQSQVSACGSSIATQVVKSSKNPNAYIVQVTWPNNHKMPIISAKRWSEKFKDMESVLRNVQMRQEIAQ